ncbi:MULTISPECIES: CcdB family protein [Photorhabdus]|uniref:Toxin CcdB n=2 Tax=Photorhabdus TaxID=29487 RepID=A0A2S8Q348_9GAMM|nr:MULTISPECIES: CcdB family protein [Photorhabdus]MBS9432042.1 cytotoxin [Photorhabdus hainanensis]MCC8457536.1 CcdB family protein [Photorhabdus aegyptia]OCA52979.1 Toxin CcdB [Photorhabdus namnaonensis]PQQ26469.1 cytotoxin [Photorhabdus hindustanensis]
MQYVVYRNIGNSDYPYLLDVQSDIIDVLDTRLMIPLFLKGNFKGNVPIRLCPILTIEESDYIVMTHEMASIRVSMIGDEVIDVTSHRKKIRDALDFLIDGF